MTLTDSMTDDILDYNDKNKIHSTNQILKRNSMKKIHSFLDHWNATYHDYLHDDDKT